MAVPRPAFGSVLRGLRAIREARIDEVIEAMRERVSSLGPEFSEHLPTSQLLTAEQLHQLEQSAELETDINNLFLLAETLGVGIGHVFWFVDLLLPTEGHTTTAPMKPIENPLDGGLAWSRYIQRMEDASQRQLPITESEAKDLYRVTGVVSDAKYRDILLRRFLRKPFRPDRYQVGVVGREDFDMSPILRPGTLLLIDTAKQLLATSDLCPLNPFYWGVHEGNHRCIWPHYRNGIIVFMTMGAEGTWVEIKDALILGVPLFAYWQLNPLALKDFYVSDFRDYDTEAFIWNVRRENDKGLVH